MTSEVEARHMKQRAVMRGWLEGKGFYLAADALELVKGLELGTRKDQQTPKFHHQLSVARLISTLTPHMMFPEETVTAAFLHDILEDHGDEWTVERLKERFGPRIAEAVWALSKKSKGFTKTYEAYFAGMTACPIASLVKLADRAHNVQTMVGVFTVEKQRMYLEEVEQWFYPMIRQARRNFPRQYPAYENLKILLRCQMTLIKEVHQAMCEGSTSTPRP